MKKAHQEVIKPMQKEKKKVSNNANVSKKKSGTLRKDERGEMASTKRRHRLTIKTR